jgi:hypothetical protein
LRPINNVPYSEGVYEGIAAPFANTFGVILDLILSNPRVGNPGLQFANTFGVDCAASFTRPLSRGGTDLLRCI